MSSPPYLCGAVQFLRAGDKAYSVAYSRLFLGQKVSVYSLNSFYQLYVMP